MSRRAPGRQVSSAALQARGRRLRARIDASTKPLVWLRAGPGSGKTQLIAILREQGGVARGSWTVLDAPDSAALRALITKIPSTDSGSRCCGRRLLVASRPGEGADEVLLRLRLYGGVEVLDDQALFLGPEDCRTKADAAMLAATGGWPMLAAAWLERRGAAIRALLPEFLEREVLPGLAPALVGALFAAATAPLEPAGVAYFSGAEPLSHPLLNIRDGFTTIAGTWVAEALTELRRQSRALSSAVLETLTGYYARLADPVESIEAMLAIGQQVAAHAIFVRSGGAFFGFRHGFQALQRVLQAFEPEGEPRSEELFIAQLWLLIKSGRTRDALLRLEARHPGLPVDLRRLRLTHRPLAVLLRIDICLDIDETPPLEVIASWGRLQALLPAGDDLARGVLFNTMAIGFLQSDALVEAEQLAEEALAAYERGGSPYLAHFAQLHLGDVALRRGRLAESADRLRRASAALAESGLAFNSEPEILETFRSWIAYEEGRFADCAAQIEPLLQALLRGDSWIDVITSTASHFALTAYWRGGLRAALERLDHIALTLSQRHGWTRHRQLQLLRIRLLQAARRHSEAALRLEEYDVEPGAPSSAPFEVEEGLTRLRSLVTAEVPDAPAVALAATLAGRPALELRQRITLAILQAWAGHRRADPALARRHLRLALREAEAHHLLGVLAEDGEFLERLLPLLIAEPGPGNARLVAFAQRVLRLLHSLPATPTYSRAVAGISRQEHRVLGYVVDGYTNKQVARALSLSDSTVKFHLRSLFRKLKVRKRADLADILLQRGIVT